MMNYFQYILITLLVGCSTVKYKKTVDYVDINKFMGKWYVVAARATFLESGAHNSLEDYSWNEKEKRIDINFSFKKNSFEGKLKNITQKAWIFNKETNAHWKVQPLWPLKLDYIVIALDEKYEWVCVGVPSESYVWIMARDWKMKKSKIDELIKKLDNLGYETNKIKYIPHKWL